jgi:hypothetical protein
LRSGPAARRIPVVRYGTVTAQTGGRSPHQTRPQRRIACGQTCRKARHARSVPLSERSRGGIRWIAGSHHAPPGIGPPVLVQHAGCRTVTSCAF